MYLSSTNAGPSQAGGHVPPHFLADQLTLSQPGGGHIIPAQYYVPPQIFRPCDIRLVCFPSIGQGKCRSFFIRHCYGRNLNVLGLTLKLHQNSFRTNRARDSFFGRHLNAVVKGLWKLLWHFLDNFQYVPWAKYDVYWVLWIMPYTILEMFNWQNFNSFSSVSPTFTELSQSRQNLGT